MVALGVGARGRRAGAVSRPLVGITTYAEPVSHGPWRDQPAGGADTDPLRYADIRHPASDAPLTERDDTEIALVRRTAELDIPVLGVCRGMQPARASLVGRAAELGFTDVITHWPRQDTVYVGSRETLETVATDGVPRLR